MSVINAITKATSQFKERNWDTLYWAIDLHGTICKFNYSNDDLTIHYYEYAWKVLTELSRIPHVKLILFTCSYEENTNKILELFKKDRIIFDFVNENPEAKNTTYGDYSKKIYFNVLLEDKAGFDPEKDWEKIYTYFTFDKWKEFSYFDDGYCPQFKTKIEYNTCENCKANDGRAGNLINKLCLNCYETKKTGKICVFSRLSRTQEELNKTFSLVGSNIDEQ